MFNLKDHLLQCKNEEFEELLKQEIRVFVEKAKAKEEKKEKVAWHLSPHPFFVKTI